VSSHESALIGGLAHLVNFQGTDTLAAVLGARIHYHEPMAGFSIPAAEHSTVTAWGREGEEAAYARMLDLYAKPGALLAVVSDSYDLERAVAQLWGGALRQRVIDSGATVVIRPDSGHPPTVVLKTVQQLAAAFGTTLTPQGFKLLQHVRVIQGDGITRASIAAILENLQRHGFAADNVAFGQGGALLQDVRRDDLGFAMKASAVCVNGTWREIAKDPATDPRKRSKPGRLTLLRRGEGDATHWTSVRLASPQHEAHLAQGWHEALRTVFEDGVLKVDDTLAAIRQRAAATP
jgi:nicotinamide phosphoribosyltransferase